jgi:hypothetical protein
MKRRDALATVPAAFYAAACHGDQDKPANTPGASYPTRPPKGGPRSVPVTEKVAVRLRDRQLEVTPQVALLVISKGAAPPSLKWEVDIPRDHTLEINFVVDYEGDTPQAKRNGQPKRGPFARAQNEVRGRYLTRGPGVLDSGGVDVGLESYWKYEVTVRTPTGQEIVQDPGVIIKEE